MSTAKLPHVEFRPLSRRSLRHRLNAPEFERFLALRDVDFSALDQPEALKVRVRRGLEVLTDRVQATSAAARRFLTISATMTAACILGAAGSAAFSLFLHRALAVEVLAGVLGSLAFLSWRSLLRASRDLRTLSALSGRYTEVVEATADLKELAELSRSIYDEVGRVAGSAKLPPRP